MIHFEIQHWNFIDEKFLLVSLYSYGIILGPARGELGGHIDANCDVIDPYPTSQ